MISFYLTIGLKIMASNCRLLMNTHLHSHCCIHLLLYVFMQKFVVFNAFSCQSVQPVYEAQIWTQAAFSAQPTFVFPLKRGVFRNINQSLRNFVNSWIRISAYTKNRKTSNNWLEIPRTFEHSTSMQINFHTLH